MHYSFLLIHSLLLEPGARAERDPISEVLRLTDCLHLFFFFLSPHVVLVAFASKDKFQARVIYAFLPMPLH